MNWSKEIGVNPFSWMKNFKFKNLHSQLSSSYDILLHLCVLISKMQSFWHVLKAASLYLGKNIKIIKTNTAPFN